MQFLNNYRSGTIIIIMGLLLGFQTNGIGQGLTDKFACLDIGLSRSSLGFDVNAYNLDFVENSIRELAYNYNGTFENKESGMNLYLGIKFGKYKGLSHSLFFELGFGKKGQGKFGYSLGYNYPIEIGRFDLLIRPSVGITTGSSHYQLGEMLIDTIGVIIDETSVIDTNVKIDVKQSNNLLIPKLEFTFLIEQKYAIYTNVSYDIGLNNKPQKVVFAPGSGSDAKDIKYSLDDASFIDMKFDDELRSENIYKVGGLVIGIGISSYFNRD